jgi:hypothetical protein
MNWGLIKWRKFLYEDTMIWNRIVHIVTRLQAGWSGVWLMTRARNIFPPKFRDQLCCPPSLLFSGDKAVGAWSWLLPRLRMSGAIPWVPVCALMACTRTNLALYLHKRVCAGGNIALIIEVSNCDAYQLTHCWVRYILRWELKT